MLEPSPTFVVSVETVPGWTVVSLEGELDLATAPVLAVALADLEKSLFPVVVDLTGLTFLDSSGVALLLKSRPGGSQLTLICPPKTVVARVLRIVRAETVLRI